MSSINLKNYRNEVHKIFSTKFEMKLSDDKNIKGYVVFVHGTMMMWVDYSSPENATDDLLRKLNNEINLENLYYMIYYEIDRTYTELDYLAMYNTLLLDKKCKESDILTFDGNFHSQNHFIKKDDKLFLKGTNNKKDERINDEIKSEEFVKLAQEHDFENHQYMFTMLYSFSDRILGG